MMPTFSFDLEAVGFLEQLQISMHFGFNGNTDHDYLLYLYTPTHAPIGEIYFTGQPITVKKLANAILSELTSEYISALEKDAANIEFLEGLCSLCLLKKKTTYYLCHQ